MLFALRLFAYRLVKPFQWPTSRVVPIPRPTTFVGPGAALKMCDSIAQFGFKRVLIVTDAILVKLGLVEPLRKALADRGVEVAVYDGITPDPTHDVLQRGFEAAMAHFDARQETTFMLGDRLETDILGAVRAGIGSILVLTGASTREMIFSVPQLIAFISSVMTLEAGDIILTGTPAGVGPLTANDVVEVSIEGIGVLRNPVVMEDTERRTF